MSASRPIEVEITMTSGCYLQVTDITGTSNFEHSYENGKKKIVIENSMYLLIS